MSFRSPAATRASYLALSAAVCLLAPHAAGHQDPAGRAPDALWQLAARLSETVLMCPERVWPNQDWRGLRIVFIKRGSSVGVSLERSDAAGWIAAAVPVDRDELGVETTREYAILRAGNMRTVAVFLNDLRERSLSRAVEVAVHEAFHVAGQRRFMLPGRIERGREIPSDWEQRYARRMLFERLFEAHRDPAALGRAAFWYQQTIRDPAGARQNALRSLDRLEGSAEYAGVFGAALHRHGCFASDQDLRAAAWRRTLENWGAARSRARLHAFPDGESYVLGLVAGLLLDESAEASWKWQVENGWTPAEILLAARTPDRDDGDPRLRDSIREALERQDAEYLPRVRSLLDRLDAGDDYVVAISSASGNVNFSPASGFFLFNDAGRARHFMLGVHGRFSSGPGRPGIELRGQDVVEDNRTPCGRGRRWVFPVPRTAVAVDQERLSVDTGAARIPAARRAQSRWLCVD